MWGGALWSFLALRQIFDATELLLHTLQQHRDGWESDSAKTLLRDDLKRNRRLLNVCYALNLNCRKSDFFTQQIHEKLTVFKRVLRACFNRKIRRFFATIALVSTEDNGQFSAFFRGNRACFEPGKLRTIRGVFRRLLREYYATFGLEIRLSTKIRLFCVISSHNIVQSMHLVYILFICLCLCFISQHGLCIYCTDCMPSSLKINTTLLPYNKTGRERSTQIC